MCIMLFLMLYRLANGKTPFVSVRVLLQALSTVDLNSSWTGMWEAIENAQTSITNTSVAFQQINSLTSFFNALGSFFTSFWNFLLIPFNLLVGVLKFITNIFASIYRVFNTALNS